MKQIILLIFITITFCSAKTISFSNEELTNIENSPNSKAIKLRLIKYIQLKNSIKDFPIEKKLNYVNSFFNKILPVNDETKYNVDDHWATPKEFILNGRGDCEDYAIAKYFTLKESGIDEKNLFLSVVKVKGATNYHMVLTYLKNKKSEPIILDNLNYKILPFSKREDLVPEFIFNEKEAYLLKNNKIDKSIRINWGKVDKWQLLLHRIYQRKE